MIATIVTGLRTRKALVAALLFMFGAGLAIFTSSHGYADDAVPPPVCAATNGICPPPPVPTVPATVDAQQPVPVPPPVATNAAPLVPLTVVSPSATTVITYPSVGLDTFWFKPFDYTHYANLGIEQVRYPMSWERIEPHAPPTPNGTPTYVWSSYDSQLATAVCQGLCKIGVELSWVKGMVSRWNFTPLITA